jgi:hypothetical protein
MKKRPFGLLAALSFFPGLMLHGGCGGLIREEEVDEVSALDARADVRDARRDVVVFAEDVAVDVTDARLDAKDADANDARQDVVDASDADADAKPDAGRVTVPLVSVNLGPVQAGTEVSFVVPPNTLGVNLAVASRTPSADLAIVSITAPNGAKVHDNATPFRGLHATSNSYFGVEAAAAVPQSNHPQAMPKVTPGTWSFKPFGASPSARLQLQTTPDGQYHGGELDLIIHVPNNMNFMGSGPITAATAASNTELQLYIDGIYDAVKAAYSLDRGAVSYAAVDSRFEFINIENLGEALSSAQGVPAGKQALQLFLSGDNGSSEFLGVAGGIPGPANSPAGTAQSGIAILFDPNFGLDPVSYGYVFAHEFGHFIGLNHTSELVQMPGDPVLHDPLEDPRVHPC